MQKKSNGKTNGNGGSQPAATGTKLSPSRDAIAHRAYELYVARGRVSGHELEDWINAEIELSGKARH
jgi:hypothetical protein